jgi:hypothetical protein
MNILTKRPQERIFLVFDFQEEGKLIENMLKLRQNRTVIKNDQSGK